MLRADLQVSKTTTWGERTATLTVAVNNLLNTTSLASFNGVVTSPRFDQPNRALPARSLTFSVGVSF